MMGCKVKVYGKRKMQELPWWWFVCKRVHKGSGEMKVKMDAKGNLRSEGESGLRNGFGKVESDHSNCMG